MCTCTGAAVRDGHAGLREPIDDAIHGLLVSGYGVAAMTTLALVHLDRFVIAVRHTRQRGEGLSLAAVTITRTFSGRSWRPAKCR